MVGDKKQSIYSFQGADPEEFDRMKRHFAEGFANVGEDLQDLQLQHSFRSSSPILDLVDATFTDEMAEGLARNAASQSMEAQSEKLADSSINLATQGAEQLVAADAAAEAALDTAVEGINEIAEGSANLGE